jgi:hypothetical protein
MATPRKTPAPAAYLPIETALHMLDMGEPGCWAAARLQAVDIPAAQEAVRLLRARERDAAKAVLEAELLRLAGPASGEQLAWFSPAAPEPMRPKPLPWCR